MVGGLLVGVTVLELLVGLLAPPEPVAEVLVAAGRLVKAGDSPVCGLTCTLEGAAAG